MQEKPRQPGDCGKRRGGGSMKSSFRKQFNNSNSAKWKRFIMKYVNNLSKEDT